MEIGAPAVLTVVEVLRFALEPALTLLQITVETNVREKLMIHKLATRILVQVMHSFFREWKVYGIFQWTIISPQELYA